MVIYNVTSKVEHSIAADWLQWIRDEHIGDLVSTGCFTHATVLRMIETDETDGLTYAVQYHAPDQKAYNYYIQQYAARMQEKSFSRWGDKVISFRSVLQVIQ